MSIKRRVMIAIAIVIACGLLAVLPYVPAVRYWGADPIERVGIETDWKLAEYERTGDPAGIHLWIAAHSDAGDGQEAFLRVAGWSMTHQKLFIHLVETLPAKERSRFIEGFAFTLGDTGQFDKFRRAYKGSGSGIVQAVLKH